MDRWTYGEIDGCIDYRMYGLMEGWMDGWFDAPKKTYATFWLTNNQTSSLLELSKNRVVSWSQDYLQIGVMINPMLCLIQYGWIKEIFCVPKLSVQAN